MNKILKELECMVLYMRGYIWGYYSEKIKRYKILTHFLSPIEFLELW